jgi:predicted lipoprotein with Yx(FWY)xxD motif
MTRTKLFVGMPLLGLLAAAACGGGSTGTGGYGTPTSATLMVTTDARLGGHLVDGNGRSLYYFAKDVPAGGTQAAASNCDAGCLAVWPVFDADIVAAQGVAQADVGQITRSDGSKQTTYQGYPLYYYVGDVAAGDTRGEGVGGTWYVVHVPAYTVALLSKANESATYLTDGAGRSLYAFALDTVGTGTTPPATACTTAACMANWHIFAPDQFTAPSALAAADLTVYTRADGARQAAYKGHPLYYYAGDAVPGQTNGRNVPNWSTIDPTAP